MSYNFAPRDLLMEEFVEQMFLDAVWQRQLYNYPIPEDGGDADFFDFLHKTITFYKETKPTLILKILIIIILKN